MVIESKIEQLKFPPIPMSRNYVVNETYYKPGKKVLGSYYGICYNKSNIFHKDDFWKSMYRQNSKLQTSKSSPELHDKLPITQPTSNTMVHPVKLLATEFTAKQTKPKSRLPLRNQTRVDLLVKNKNAEEKIQQTNTVLYHSADNVKYRKQKPHRGLLPAIDRSFNPRPRHLW